ncbi:MAG: CehA/McbA family metallohydrolase [Kofleriaceae bacterium]
MSGRARPRTAPPRARWSARLALALALALVALGCGAPAAPRLLAGADGAGPACTSAPPAPPAPSSASVPSSASAPSAPSSASAPSAPARWLKGSTHVHARPSGDSRTPIPDVLAWYRDHGYDFIALTDHNKVSELDEHRDTFGRVAVSAPEDGLIVLAGIELTHNPDPCVPAPPEPDGRCRIHVNALGVTARPAGRLEWADRRSDLRLDFYRRALITTRELGGLAQVNHPQWFWGMSAELLIALARSAPLLLEIANVQFASWNEGGAGQPSTEALWDAALAAGLTVWGVASDDAHTYDGDGPYPAGGGWVMVHAAPDPDAILAALARGAFYASTGVVLARAGREGEELVVEVSPTSPGAHRIVFIENGARVAEIVGARARRSLPARGTLRAVVTRADGARAWVQPARR